MNRLPSIVTSHSGILARKPTSSIAVMISGGRAADAFVIPPTPLAAVATMPLHTSKMFTIKSMP